MANKRLGYREQINLDAWELKRSLEKNIWTVFAVNCEGRVRVIFVRTEADAPHLLAVARWLATGADCACLESTRAPRPPLLLQYVTPVMYIMMITRRALPGMW